MIKSGWCVWITGLPGSGKSVVSRALAETLAAKSIRPQILSSDSLRKVLTPTPTYSSAERDIVYAALVYTATLLTENGVNVIIDATGNLKKYRDEARLQIQRFFEVYLECPLNICIERETEREETYGAPKEIYARAKVGRAPTVPGMGEPYEPPSHPELAIDAMTTSPREIAQQILMNLKLDQLI